MPPRELPNSVLVVGRRTQTRTPPNEPISAIPRPVWRGGPLTAGASARRRSWSLEPRETADIVGHVMRHPRNDLSTERCRGRSAWEAAEARRVFKGAHAGLAARGDDQVAVNRCGAGRQVGAPDDRGTEGGRPRQDLGGVLLKARGRFRGFPEVLSGRGRFRSTSVGGESTRCDSRRPVCGGKVGELEVREPGDNRLTGDGEAHVGASGQGVALAAWVAARRWRATAGLRTAYLPYRANDFPNWGAGRRVLSLRSRRITSRYLPFRAAGGRMAHLARAPPLRGGHTGANARNGRYRRSR